MTQASIVNLEGRTVDDSRVEAFRTDLRGRLLRPSDGGYDLARRVWNAMIDKHPSLIAKCAGPADVVRAVKFARENNLLIAVRGGGHNVAGKAVCDGGLVIDLSDMRSIRVDSTASSVRAEPGVTLGELDHETQAFGLATTLGIVSKTGISGLTLGGGIGWLNGKYGLACDNLLSADVVTADGNLLKANSRENMDLYWGLRGGGGNFGIVTSFEYKVHPVSTVLGGMVLFEMHKALDVLHFYDDFSRGCPDDLTTAAALLNAPDGNPVVAIFVCYSGDLQEGERVLKPLRKFDSPIADLVKPIKYTELQRLLDGGFQPGFLNYWKSNFLRRAMSDEAINTLVEQATKRPSPMSAIALQQMHGAASRVGPTETAFPHRYEQYDMVILSVWANSADTERNVNWTRGLWQAMQPFVERGVYVNNLGEEGEDRVRDAYGPNYERLVGLKNKFDPTNLFRLNQNIRPAIHTM